MSNFQSIVAAETKQIYKVSDVIQAAQKITSKADSPLADLYEKMLVKGGDRFMVKPSSMPQMDHLYDELPNFSDVLDKIKRSLALCIDSADPIDVQPIMLLGEPGVGKTHFASAIANLFGTGTALIPMASQTAGFIMSGSSSQWKGAKPGKVFDAFMSGDYANPVFIIDEIDKASQGAQYDPLGPLYTLLEPETATHFVDEFADVPIDTKGAIWFSTANDTKGIPSPILSRMEIFEIQKPTPEQAAIIARRIYRKLRGEYNWGERFPDEMSLPVLEYTQTLPTRAIRGALIDAFGNAKLAKRETVLVEDFESSKKKSKVTLGFL